jgi:imidazolonepropionase-like amidohydrolase
MRLPFAIAAALVSISSTAFAQEGTVRIRAALLLDGTGKLVRNGTVVVAGTKIRAIETTRSGPPTYDLGRLTVLPGMIDVHAHVAWHFDKDGRYRDRPGPPAQEILYSAENAYLTLMAGFTTIQSPGSASDLDLREAIARGVLPGPRILTSIRPLNQNSGSPEEIRDKVRKLKADGADVVKIFASRSIRDGGGQTMSNEQLAAACSEARAQGLRTMVHAHSPPSVKAAVDAGCHQIEHGTLVDDDSLRLMAQKGVYFDPNVGLVTQNYLRHKARFLGTGNYTEEGFAWMEKGLALKDAMIKQAVATPGLKLVLGTDAVAGAHGRNADEIVERVQKGRQKPMDAIVSATSLAAQSLGLAGEVGSLAAGKEADIIALDGNPLTDITAVTRVVFVMKAGRLYKNVAPSKTTR